MMNLKIEFLDGDYTVSQVEDYSLVDLEKPMTFAQNTGDEKSLVSPTSFVPSNTIKRDDGWITFRVAGQLDFSLIGILSFLSKILSDASIGIFAISTYNTDYIFIKKEMKEKAVKALLDEGVEII